MSPKRIAALTPEQTSQLEAHADRWIEVGLQTQPMDLESFTSGAKRCYAAAGVEWPGVVVRVPSPLVMVLAGPVAALVVELEKGKMDATAVGEAVGGAVDGAVHGAVREAVHEAVDGAVREAVHEAVDGAVDEAVRGAVHGAVDGAVRGAVHGAVREAVHGAVRGAVREASPRPESSSDVKRIVRQAVADVISGRWNYYLGGWYTYWLAWTTYFRDVADLELSGDLWERSRAYEDCTVAAGWWWPHKHFVMVCDRPSVIHREQVRPRGWGSHRLHRENGPAIAWRDGWALYYVHGVRVTEQIVMRPETITVDRVLQEGNAEVRRVMIERMAGGWLGFCEEADLMLLDESPDPANAPHTIKLYELPQGIRNTLGVPVRLLVCSNGTPERDGTRRTFGLTVDVKHKKALDAAGSTYGLTGKQYAQLARRT